MLFCKAAVSGSNPDQKVKFNGVITAASNVIQVVRVTDRATFAPERREMKLETLPPGQAATRNSPSSYAGLRSP